MKSEEPFHKILLDNLFDGVYFVDPNRVITYWNRAAENLIGYNANDVVGSCCSDNILQHVDDQGNNLCNGRCPLKRTIEDGKERKREIYLYHKKGHRVPVLVKVAPIRNNENYITGAVEIFSDNSAVHKLRSQAKHLATQSLMDPLTKMGNRRYAEKILESRLQEMQRYNWPFGIIFFDIDHFKIINDKHGHEAGDRVLRMLSRTLRNNIRIFDQLFRWGGEEIIAVITNVDKKALKAIAEKLRILAEKSGLKYHGKFINVTVSVGATLAIKGDNAVSLIKRADLLMYKSKQNGRNRVSIDA